VISFRYHLVSLIGVFLALALGVVIGTTAVNGAVVGDLRRQVKDLKASSANASTQNKSLQAQASNANILAKSFGSEIAGQALAKTNVVIVTAPGASSSVADALATEVASTGGRVTARVQLAQSFSDPNRAADIRSLATSGAHPVGLQLPTTDDAGLLAGSLLGYVLLGHGQGTDLTQVIAGFSTLNMVTTSGGNVTSGKIILLVTTGSRPADDAATRMLSNFATQISLTGGPVVVIGDAASATKGGLIAQLRASSSSGRSLSTVDDGDDALGQMTAMLVAKETMAGRAGDFGTGPGVDALLPGVASS
jgi:Copper transport outer membrane protein, MctB